VPAQQRLRLDKERFPASSREHPGQRGYEAAVCRPIVAPASDLALEELELNK
jgi:hypothetical protein